MHGSAANIAIDEAALGVKGRVPSEASAAGGRIATAWRSPQVAKLGDRSGRATRTGLEAAYPRVATW